MAKAAPLRQTCPACGERYPFEAGFADADGKRLAALAAGMEPRLARAALGYLRLFQAGKPLSLADAGRLLRELTTMVDSGSVRHKGSPLRRTTPAIWAEGIETMLAQRATLRLPLGGHGYLIAIVAGIADAAADAPPGSREPLAFDRPQAMNDALEALSLKRAEKIIAEYEAEKNAWQDSGSPGGVRNDGEIAADDVRDDEDAA